MVDASNARNVQAHVTFNLAKSDQMTNQDTTYGKFKAAKAHFNHESVKK